MVAGGWHVEPETLSSMQHLSWAPDLPAASQDMKVTSRKATQVQFSCSVAGLIHPVKQMPWGQQPTNDQVLQTGNCRVSSFHGSSLQFSRWSRQCFRLVAAAAGVK